MMYSTLVSRFRRLARPIAVVLLSVVVGGGVAAASPVTWLDQDGAPLPSDLAVGDDLQVGLSGLMPGRAYELDLVDDAQNVIARRAVVADSSGKVSVEKLWAMTGVVGCDESGNIFQSGAYHYASLQDADLDLNGRTFELHLKNPNQGLVASRQILLGSRSEPIFYFADVTGCLRQELDTGEDLYLAGEVLPMSVGAWTFFLVDGVAPLTVGSPLVDVRQSGPQVIQVPAGRSRFLTLAWDNLDSFAGPFTGLVRPGSSVKPVVDPGDEVVCSPKGGGIVISSWEPCNGCD